MREQQAASKQAPRYDNRHRDLTSEQQQAFIAEGRQATIRFRIDDQATITWSDLVRGEMRVGRRRPRWRHGDPPAAPPPTRSADPFTTWWWWWTMPPWRSAM
jgi:Glutamyl- and glutaminyl-tRNA synthetases